MKDNLKDESDVFQSVLNTPGLVAGQRGAAGAAGVQDHAPKLYGHHLRQAVIGSLGMQATLLFGGCLVEVVHQDCACLGLSLSQGRQVVG